jgi:hypothetical protein
MNPAFHSVLSADESDRRGTPRPPNPNVPNYDQLSPGRTVEPITVYTRNGVLNRRVGGFDLTPEPAVHDLGEVWLLANETLVPDASRFYRSRPNNFRNPLMTSEGTPSVAFRWMEVEGPLQDETTLTGYRLLFGDLPLRRARAGESGVAVPVVREAARADGSLRRRGAPPVASPGPGFGDALGALVQPARYRESGRRSCCDMTVHLCEDYGRLSGTTMGRTGESGTFTTVTPST